MSPAEIEEVKRFWTDEGGDFSATGLRLLEERERLLEALRPFAEGAQTGTFRAMMTEAGADERLEQIIAAWDAVTFAEAPATARASEAGQP